MFLPPWADNHSYATASAQHYKCGHLVCLYIGNKKDHCSQPYYVREDIKCADRPRCRPIVRPRPTAGLWSPIPGIQSAIVPPHRVPSTLSDFCPSFAGQKMPSFVFRVFWVTNRPELRSGYQSICLMSWLWWQADHVTNSLVRRGTSTSVLGHFSPFFEDRTDRYM